MKIEECRIGIIRIGWYSALLILHSALFVIRQGKLQLPRRPILVVLFVSVSLLPLSALAQRMPDMEKNRKREVAEIRFEGDTNISALELESIIATKISNWLGRTANWISSDWGAPRQFVDESILDEDTLRIFVYYRSRGYFDARVRYSQHESKESVDAWQKVHDHNLLPSANREQYPLIEDTIIFHIIEGMPYKVAGFTFEGLENLPMDLQNKLTENIGIKANSIYSKEVLEKEILRIQLILSENGYPFLSLPNGATVIDIDKQRKSVTISLKFRTGPRIRVGAAKIVNDTAFAKFGYVDDDVVRRQISLDSGAWYKNTEKLASERDINRLGTFQYVNIEIDTSAFANLSDSAKNGVTLPIVIYLRMRQASNVDLFPFFGINAFYQFIFGAGATYTNRNIFNGAQNFTLHSSYQILPWNQKLGSIGGDFVLPYIGLKNVPLIFSGNYTYSDQRTTDLSMLQYLERTGIASLGTNFQLSKDPLFVVTLSPKFSFQYVNRDYRDSSIFNGHIDTTIPSQFNFLGSFDLVFNWTNDPKNPSRGSYIGLSLQQTLPFVTIPKIPSAAYTKFTPQFKTFFNLSPTEGRSVLGYRIVYGNVWLAHPGDPTRDILIEDRYFGGGTNSLRGWAARSLLVSNDSVPGHPQFGGYKTFETNLEWRYALFNYPTEQFLSPLRLAFFCDAGNVWDKDVPIAPKNFTVSLGTGLRYNTIIGAIRVDFGFKFYDPYPQATLGKGNNKDLIVAMPPNSASGEWLWNRKGSTFWDVFNFEFALGQAF